MYFSDSIKLRAVVSTYDSNGFEQKAVTKTTVWANKHSVTRSEFYNAQSVKMRADIGFTVHIEDYNNQTEIEYSSVIYDVIRSFELDSENIDLTCARR